MWHVPASEERLAEVSLVSLAFVRDMIVITADQGDLIDALIFTTALDANMAPVDGAPDLSVRYGGVEDSAPDELRRPVSMHAVAQSLGLPAETVRRRFNELVRTGVCLSTPQGIVVPRASVVSEPYKALQRARYERARLWHRSLVAMEVLPPPTRDVPAAEAPLVRAANRAISEYTLRGCRGLLDLTGHVLSSIVLIQLVLENTRGMGGEALERWMRNPEEQATLVRIPHLAQGLPVSRETVRRHLRTLQELGFCRRIPGGYVAVPPAGAEARLVELAHNNLAAVRRIFARLDRLGVLSAWLDCDPPTR